MNEYCLKISSKNEKSLKKISTFFFKHFRTKFNIIQKDIVTRNRKRIITLLKSPHVNKSAQEHFESRIFSKQILIKSFSQEKNLILLKKNFNRLFQDISVTLEFADNLSLNYKNRLLAFHLDNFKLPKNGSVNKNIKRAKQKIISKKNSLTNRPLIKLENFLNISSVFGEMLVV